MLKQTSFVFLVLNLSMLQSIMTGALCFNCSLNDLTGLDRLARLDDTGLKQSRPRTNWAGSRRPRTNWAGSRLPRRVVAAQALPVSCYDSATNSNS